MHVYSVLMNYFISKTKVFQSPKAATQTAKENKHDGGMMTCAKYKTGSLHTYAPYKHLLDTKEFSVFFSRRSAQKKI